MKELAHQLGYRTRRLGDGEVVIRCRRGWIAREVPGRLAWVRLVEGERPGTSHLLRQVEQDEQLELELAGDAEFIATFAEGDLEHVAERWARAYRKRRVSEEERRRLADLSRRFSPLRPSPSVTSTKTGQNAPKRSVATSRSSGAADARGALSSSCGGLL